MVRAGIGCVVLAAVLGWVFEGSADLDRQLLEISLRGQGIRGVLPETASTPALALADEFGPEAGLAAARFGEPAVQLYAIFGDTPEWQEVIHQYGAPQVVPVVWWYWQNDSKLMNVEESAGAAMRSIISSVREMSLVAVKPEELSPEDRAWRAVLAIKEVGNNFLGRFAVKDSKAHPIVSKEIVAVVENFAIGGIQKFEAKWKTGEEISLGDYASAGLETIGIGLVVLKGASRVARALSQTGKISKVGAVTGRAAKVLISLPKLLRFRAVRWGAGLTLGYAVVTHPAIVDAAFQQFGAWMGFDPHLVRFVCWFALVAGVLLLLSPFWSWAILPALWWCVSKVYNRLAAALKRKYAST